MTVDRPALAVVWIDDGCNTCGRSNELGILFGPGLPVICFLCLAAATMAWEAVPPNLRNLGSAAQRRKGL